MPIPEHVRSANKRMAVIGRFSTSTPVQRYRFAKDNTSAGVHKLNAQSFFDTVRPELRMTVGGQLKIGAYAYNMNELVTPLSATGDSKSVPILRDSPLLDFEIADGVDPAAPIRQKGGQLMQELVGHLDVMAMMSHPRFVRILTWIVLRRVPGFANADAALIGTDKQIFASRLQASLRNDPVLMDRVINLLLCTDDDDQQVIGALTKALADLQNSPWDDDSNVRSKQIDAVVAAVRQLKAGLLSNDKSLRKIISEGDKAPWVTNLAEAEASDEVTFAVRGAKLNGVNDFFILFRTLRESSDWVSRFMRNPIYHSFVFCWLAGKYADYTKDFLDPAADAMAEIGIKNQIGRTLSEPQAERNRRIALVRQELDRLSKQDDDNLRRHLQIVLERMLTYFIPSFSYTRERHFEATRSLFLACCQEAGGVVGAIHDANAQLNKEMMEVYQPLLRLCSDLQQKAHLDKKPYGEHEVTIQSKSVADELAAAAKSAGAKQLLADLIKDLPPEISIKVLKDKFYVCAGGSVVQHFRAAYKDAEASIKDEARELRALFDLWMNVTAEAGDSAPGQTFAVVDAEIFHLADRKNVSKGTFAQTLRAIASSTGRELDLPEQLSDQLSKLPEGSAPKLDQARVVYGDKTAATVRIDTKKKTMTVVPEKDFKLDGGTIEASRAKVVVPTNGAATAEVSVADMADKGVEHFVRDKAALESALSKWETLNKKLELLHNTYLSDKSEKSGFRRRYRALQLGKNTLGVPRDQVNLDTRDLSNSTGVLFRIAESMGELTPALYAPDSLFDRQGNPAEGKEADVERLRNLDLSQFYPFADPDLDSTVGNNRMSSVLQYHLKLAQQLVTAKEYLRELRELKALLGELALTDIELDVVNGDMSAYFSDRVKTDLFHVNPPLLVYATMQSKADVAGQGVMSSHVVFRRRDPQGVEFQAPLLVLAPGLAPAAGLAIPCVAIDPAKLPLFGPGGLSMTKAIESTPSMSYCVALLTTEIDLGEPSQPSAVTAYLSDRKLPSWNTTAIGAASYLRSLWPEEVVRQIQTLKWYNLAHNELGDAARENGPKSLQSTLKRLYDGTDPSTKANREALFAGLPPQLAQPLNPFMKASGDAGWQSWNGSQCFVPGLSVQVDGKPVETKWLDALA